MMGSASIASSCSSWRLSVNLWADEPPAKPAQRLYLEVRHAVRQLYVKQGGNGATSAGDAWFAAGGGGLIRTPADAGDLPGPCGGHSLHVQRRGGGGAAAAATGGGGALPAAQGALSC